MYSKCANFSIYSETGIERRLLDTLNSPMNMRHTADVQCKALNNPMNMRHTADVQCKALSDQV